MINIYKSACQWQNVKMGSLTKYAEENPPHCCRVAGHTRRFSGPSLLGYILFPTLLCPSFTSSSSVISWLICLYSLLSSMGILLSSIGSWCLLGSSQDLPSLMLDVPFWRWWEHKIASFVSGIFGMFALLCEYCCSSIILLRYFPRALLCISTLHWLALPWHACPLWQVIQNIHDSISIKHMASMQY